MTDPTESETPLPDWIADHMRRYLVSCISGSLHKSRSHFGCCQGATTKLYWAILLGGATTAARKRASELCDELLVQDTGDRRRGWSHLERCCDPSADDNGSALGEGEDPTSHLRPERGRLLGSSLPRRSTHAPGLVSQSRSTTGGRSPSSSRSISCQSANGERR